MKIHFLLSNNEEKLMTHNWEFSHIKSTGYFLKVKVWIHRPWSVTWFHSELKVQQFQMKKSDTYWNYRDHIYVFLSSIDKMLYFLTVNFLCASKISPSFHVCRIKCIFEFNQCIKNLQNFIFSMKLPPFLPELTRYQPWHFQWIPRKPTEVFSGRKVENSQLKFRVKFRNFLN